MPLLPLSFVNNGSRECGERAQDHANSSGAMSLNDKICTRSYGSGGNDKYDTIGQEFPTVVERLF